MTTPLRCRSYEVLKDPHAFFRRGRPGEGRALLGAADLVAYERRMRGPVDDPELLRLLGVPD